MNTWAYDPLPSQRRFHSNLAQYKGYSGPVGSGKSLALVYEAIFLSRMNPGGLGLIGAPTYGMLRDVTQRAFFEVLETEGFVEDRDFAFLKQENRLVFRDSGSEVIFRTLDNPERLRGTNLCWFGIDELTFCKEEAFQRLQARLRDPKSKRLCGFGCWTPNGFNWAYDLFIGEKKPSNFDTISAIPGENKYLPPDFYSKLAESYDERFYRQEVLGEYLPLQAGTVYYSFQRDRNVDAAISYDPSCRLVWTLDFNIDPMASAIAQIRSSETEIDSGTQYGIPAVQRKRTIEVLDEIFIRDANVNMACDTFIDRTRKYISPGGRLKVDIYGDPAGNNRDHGGRSDWQMVRDYMARWPEYDLSFRVPKAHPLIRDRVNAVNGVLYSSTGDIRCTVHPRCKQLIKDLERVSWKRDANKNILGTFDTKDSQLTHISDAFGYLVAQEFPLANRMSVTLI
jgi:hypothetical protein